MPSLGELVGFSRCALYSPKSGAHTIEMWGVSCGGGERRQGRAGWEDAVRWACPESAARRRACAPAARHAPACGRCLILRVSPRPAPAAACRCRWPGCCRRGSCASARARGRRGQTGTQPGRGGAGGRAAAAVRIAAATACEATTGPLGTKPGIRPECWAGPQRGLHLGDDADEAEAAHEGAPLVAVAVAGVDVAGAVHPGNLGGKEGLGGGGGRRAKAGGGSGECVTRGAGAAAAAMPASRQPCPTAADSSAPAAAHQRTLAHVGAAVGRRRQQPACGWAGAACRDGWRQGPCLVAGRHGCPAAAHQGQQASRPAPISRCAPMVRPLKVVGAPIGGDQPFCLAASSSPATWMPACTRTRFFPVSTPSTRLRRSVSTTTPLGQGEE
jgi:hypothetical protein